MPSYEKDSFFDEEEDYDNQIMGPGEFTTNQPHYYANNFAQSQQLSKPPLIGRNQGRKKPMQKHVNMPYYDY